MGWIEEAKRRAALEAVKHVQDGYVVGLGTGSTAAYGIEEIGKRIKRESLQILGVPTSYQAMISARNYGVPMTTLAEHPSIEVAIDGADQLDNELNLIKGGGGAFTREKIVASAAKRLIIVADKTKLVQNLGKNHSIPIEVLPFALPTVVARLNELGGNPNVRESQGKAGPVVTDNGNFIVDVNFGALNAPKELDSQLRSIPGVIETGLFIGVTSVAYIGTPTAVDKLERK